MEHDPEATVAWQIAKERTGKMPVPEGVTVVPLAHPYRADVVQRIVYGELERGTPPRIVRQAVFSLDALTAITVRHACARISTAEQDARRQEEVEHGTRERPRISSFDRIAALVDTDPAQALRVMMDPALVLTADERALLMDEARQFAKTRGDL